jgi:hypothetical protein
MVPESVLVEYALAVSRMRELQLKVTPGATRELREQIKAAETEVDYLTTFHLIPTIPELPPHMQ